MRILNFQARGLHGYLDFDVPLNERLTFLTGINGSGKTTVLNAIVALISPGLPALQSWEYESIKVTFLNDSDEECYIEAGRSDGKIWIESNTSAERFSYRPYTSEAGPTFRQREAEAEHFKELLVENSGHSVLKFIDSLPTPMFLGLDRRSKVSQDDYRYPMRMRRSSLVSRNVFASSIATSMIEAIELVEDAYRRVRFEASRVGEQLQRKMLLSLLTFTKEDYGDLQPPTKQEIEDLKRVKADLKAFPEIFNLPEKEVAKRIGPFINQTEKTIEQIPDDADVTKDFTESKGSPKYFNALISWGANKSQIRKMKIVSEMVSSFDQRREKVLETFGGVSP